MAGNSVLREDEGPARRPAARDIPRVPHLQGYSMSVSKLKIKWDMRSWRSTFGVDWINSPVMVQPSLRILWAPDYCAVSFGFRVYGGVR